MALTVRYPSGVAITYNDANHLTYGDGSFVLRKIKDGCLVACIQASAGVVVEFTPPCKIENPLTVSTIREAAKYLCENAEAAHDLETNARLADLKRLLARFNARKTSWRKAQ